MVVDPRGILRGIFTDSDLARLFETRRDDALDGSIREVMTKNPASVPAGSMMTDAVEIMGERKISELPVVDSEGRPLGLLDVTDIVALFPEGSVAGESARPAKSLGPPPPHAAAFNRTAIRSGLPAAPTNDERAARVIQGPRI